MKRFLMVVGGVLWFALVFLVTWRLTFPSEAVGQRVKVEVAKATGGQYQLALSDLAPWWTGVQAENVILTEMKRGEATPVFAFEAARVKAGLFSLIRNEPRLNGAVTVGSSDLDFDVTVGMNKRGTQLVPRSVNLYTDQFPIQDLAGMAGAGVDASGGLDIEVELEAGEGMRDALGDARIRGRDLLITSLDPELTGGMDLGMEIPIEEVDIHFEVEEGKATVRTGRIRSPLVDTEMEGEITLREDIGRSSMELTFALELGDELEMFKSFLKRAEWDDGKFHYKCTGSFNRPICREDAQRGGSARRGSRRGGARRPTANTPRTTLSPEEREQRRQEALERLRRNRERRAGSDSRSGGTETAADEEDLPPEELEEIGYAEDDEYLDEELPPEELPLEEDIILDEEPIFDEP